MKIAYLMDQHPYLSSTFIRQDIAVRYEYARNVSEDPRVVCDFFCRRQSCATIATFFMFVDVRSTGGERSIMFDNDVHRLLEILPGRVRDRAHFGMNLVRKLWPDAAKVCDANTLLPLSFPPQAHTLARAMRPLFGKARRLLFENNYETTGSWPKTSLLYWNEPEWRRCFEEILQREDLLPGEIFDRDAIQKCWKAFASGKLERATDLERLITIGALNRSLGSN